MRNYVTEFIGTLCLCLTIGLTVLGGTPLAPLAIGASLMVMVYMGGHVSGGHYNPAVSLAVLLRGKMASVTEFVGYVVAQCAGAVVAALVVYVVLGKTFAPAPAPSASFMAALLVELPYTFALALVVLNSAASAKTHGNRSTGSRSGSPSSSPRSPAGPSPAARSFPPSASGRSWSTRCSAAGRFAT